MILSLEEIDKINDYPKEKWEDLLALIPVIEQLNNHDKSLDTIADPIALKQKLYSQLYTQFHKIVHKMEIVIAFDWVNWHQGIELLRNEKASFHHLSLIELCKLITAIVRKERFCEGTIIALLANGTILKILKTIETKVKEKPK